MSKIKSPYHSTWLLGAAGGIGSSIAAMVGDYTKNLSLCDLKKAIIRRNLRRTAFWQVDCSDEDAFSEFAKQTTRRFDSPDLMIVAAGYVSSLSLEETTSKEREKIFNNNFSIVSNALKYFFVHCSKNSNVEKNIVIISSNAGLEPRPNQPIYAAAKSAINSLAQSQAVEWGKYNIKINILAPGTVAVERNIRTLRQKYKNFPKDPARPLGKICAPPDLHSTLRLLLDKKLLMTGQIIVIDGGSTLI